MKEGTRWIPRYLYDLFSISVGKYFKRMFCVWMNALSMEGLSLDLLGHPIIARLDRLRSRCDHLENFGSFLIWGWIHIVLSMRISRSFTYVVVLHMEGEVLKLHPY